MKLYTILVFCLFMSCSGLKNPKKIECILVESPTSFLHCGIFSVCVGMKFQKVNNNTLFVGLINCPELKGNDFFKIGNKYKIKINDEKINKVCEITRNEYSNQNLTTYFLEDIYYIK